MAGELIVSGKTEIAIPKLVLDAGGAAGFAYEEFLFGSVSNEHTRAHTAGASAISCARWNSSMARRSPGSRHAWCGSIWAASIAQWRRRSCG